MHAVPMDLDHDEVEALSMGLGLVINPHHLHHLGKHIVVLHPTTLKKMRAAHHKGKHHLLKFKAGEGFFDTLKSAAKAVVKHHIPKVVEHVGHHAGHHLGHLAASKLGFDAERGAELGSKYGAQFGHKLGTHIAHNMGEGLRHHKHLRTHHKHSLHGGAVVRAHSRHIAPPPEPSGVTQLGSPYARVNSPQMNPFFSNVNQNGGYNPLGRVHRSMSGGSFTTAGGGAHQHYDMQQHKYVSL